MLCTANNRTPAINSNESFEKGKKDAVLVEQSQSHSQPSVSSSGQATNPVQTNLLDKLKIKRVKIGSSDPRQLLPDESARLQNASKTNLKATRDKSSIDEVFKYEFYT